ncbi:MAG: hypothetical protein WCO22_11580 [Betaproteobacteria bacterium]
MKRHKDQGSTPAGVPHLQEVGYTVTYEDVVVTAEYLKQLKAEIRAADVRAKYGLFRSSLFYGNLRRWQRQGWHCVYTNGPGTTHCTCGLILHENGTANQEIAVVISKNVQHKLDGIESEQIHQVRGHIGLPSLKGETVALIVNYVYKEDINVYLWTAICQQCGDYQIEVKNADAKSFVKTHNRICGPMIFNKKGV